MFETAEVIAVLKYDEKLQKWQVFLKDKIIARSNSKEYAISKVLDETGKRMKLHGVTRLVDIDGKEITYVQMIKESSIVKKQDIFHTLVDESIANRKMINEVLGEKMKNLRELFSCLFLVDKQEFTTLKDAMYYQGGWPTPDSPAKLDTMFHNLSVIMKYYQFLGNEKDLHVYFKRYGLTVSLNSATMEKLDTRMDLSVKECWAKCFKKKMPSTKKAVLEMVMTDALSTQKEICQRADAIKKNAAGRAESHCGVNPADFVHAVNSAYKARKTGQKVNSVLYQAKLKHIINESALTVAIETQE